MPDRESCIIRFGEKQILVIWWDTGEWSAFIVCRIDRVDCLSERTVVWVKGDTANRVFNLFQPLGQLELCSNIGVSRQEPTLEMFRKMPDRWNGDPLWLCYGPNHIRPGLIPDRRLLLGSGFGYKKTDGWYWLKKWYICQMDASGDKFLLWMIRVAIIALW